MCKPDRAHEAGGWDTPYVHATCRVLAPNAPVKALGATMGATEAVQSDAMRVCEEVARKHQVISSLGCSAAALVLTRRRADVGNVNYWLRCYGDILSEAPANRFDADLRAALEESLGGTLPDTAWWQAGIAVRQGGLGLRSARDVALPAFIGSRVASRPIVAHMFRHLENAGLAIAQQLLGLYDVRLSGAVAAFKQSLPDLVHADVDQYVQDGAGLAARRFSRLIQGRRVAADHADEIEDGQRSLRQIGSVAPGFVQDAGAQDDEHPDFSGGPRGPPVQQRNPCELVGRCTAAGLKEHFAGADVTLDVDRLKDLAHKGNSHGWLWALSPHQGPMIEDDREFMEETVRVRLGAGGPPDVGMCGCCGRAHGWGPRLMLRLGRGHQEPQRAARQPLRIRFDR